MSQTDAVMAQTDIDIAEIGPVRADDHLDAQVLTQQAKSARAARRFR